MIYNPLNMKKNPLLLLLILTMPFAAAAQGGEIDKLLGSSIKDAQYLIGGYAGPMLKAVGHGMNQGWYQTAAPHKFPGFDLTLSVNPVFVPTVDKTFNVDNTKLERVYLSSDMNGRDPGVNGTGPVPTLFGSKDKNTQFSPKPGYTGGFGGPKGIGLGILPLPTLNLGIGLPKGFDLKFRYVPTLDLGKLTQDNLTGQFGLFGVAVMHDFKQYIPGIKSLPFDMSVFVGYTQMKLTVDIDKQANQKGEFTSSATTIQALISKKLAVLTAYAGVGMNLATTKLAAKGSYTFGGLGAPVTDPFTLSETSNGPRGTLGLRLKLGPIAFHGDYTLAKYKAASVGLGISVR